MKKLSLILSFIVAVSVANAQTSTPSTVITTDINKVLSFKEAEHNFGKIAYGKAVEYDVEIKNIGTETIKIENVQVSCGCTTPKYEKDKTIAPGETVKVTLGFNGYSEGKFEKYVTIYLSGGLTKQVKFFGETVKDATTLKQ